MRTYLDCIPCLLRGALEQARLATDDELVHRDIINSVAALIPRFSFGMTPPEMTRFMHQIIADKCGPRDFFKAIKKQSNERALSLYPMLKEKVNQSTDRLLTALEIAIAGNIIDYGAKNMLNVDQEIHKLTQGDFGADKKNVFDYAHFCEALNKVGTVLYLGDNAGETVFDRVLIEEFAEMKKVTYAVRGKPTINDALMEDAVASGLDKIVRVVSSGVDTPGTVLRYCSDEFLGIFRSAELIISKGQGNYEALSDIDGGVTSGVVYFLFKVKCPVIARHAGALVGDIVLKRK